ncbi:hypothetical protein TNCV_974731 [Trichonephila clavipes]|nr:hypothetical protein TNCV_974731 [Trichonephila clavipes]
MERTLINKDNASGHMPMSTAAYLAKKETETRVKCIPFDEICVITPLICNELLCFWFIKMNLRITASKDTEWSLENCSRRMELLLFPIPLEQESLHQVHLTFPRNSVTHQVLLFIQLLQGSAPAI